ncbi:helix-turn-helix domain-containing protein [Halobaculum sp. MBLA0143]|uniref:helix-turn-helix domain-containing protein n=1 Tax=Halobaculum sp. MBLA0143 TaxID=3079933 RepID=UPI0035241015
MSEPVADQLRTEMECEGLLECLYGLTELDREVFGALVESETALTVDQVAETVDRERSTAYRSVRRLVDTGLVEREQINYDDGGYYHVFSPVDGEEAAGEFQRLLNEWYAQMGGLIAEFREKYDGAAAERSE